MQIICQTDPKNEIYILVLKSCLIINNFTSETNVILILLNLEKLVIHSWWKILFRTTRLVDEFYICDSQVFNKGRMEVFEQRICLNS